MAWHLGYHMAVDRFVIRQWRPASSFSLDDADLRIARTQALLSPCRVCPRECRVDRLAGRVGLCGTGKRARINSAFPHHGEEDCLRGTRGSGTIFIGRCGLNCVFCQNWDVSQPYSAAGLSLAGARGRTAALCLGEELDAEEIAGLMLQLQNLGCHNVNFVTPTHVVPQLVEAILLAAEDGLDLPVVYNSGGYDSVETLQLLDGLVDVYMPDFKFWVPDTADRLTDAPDYPERARAALREMYRQVGDLQTGPDGLARRGLLVRHLVMPSQLDESEAIFEFLAKEISPDTFVNVMGQYHPAYRVGVPGPDGKPLFPDIDRRPTAGELRTAYALARRAGLWRFDGVPPG